MSIAATVPETRGELEGDDAFETARAIGLRALLRDSFVRFRYADGFSVFPMREEGLEAARLRE